MWSDHVFYLVIITQLCKTIIDRRSIKVALDYCWMQKKSSFISTVSHAKLIVKQKFIGKTVTWMHAMNSPVTASLPLFGKTLRALLDSVM